MPDGRVRLIVLSQGFERLDYVVELVAGEQLDIEYYQQRLASNPFRTVVDTRRDEPEVTRRTITADEINALPGTQGDALKSIQNFPGVARAPLGAGLLVVRGSAPSDSKVYLGYHEIPQLFHFGALTSVFNSDILAQIDFIPGNFDSRFGDAIGGIINVQPRKGRRTWHGYVDSDIFDTGVLLEGPVGKGSFALSGRRSYIDAILPAVIPDDAGIDFELAPRYYDYQGLFDYPVGGGELSIRVFGLGRPPRADRPRCQRGGGRPGGHLRHGDPLSPGGHRLQEAAGALDLPDHALLSPRQGHGLGLGHLRVRAGHRYLLGSGRDRASALTPFCDPRRHRDPGRPVSHRRPRPRRAGAGRGHHGGADRWRAKGRLPLHRAVHDGHDRGDRPLHALPGSAPELQRTVVQEDGLRPRACASRGRWATTTRRSRVGWACSRQIPDPPEFNPVWGNPNVALEKGVHTSLGVAQVIEQWDVTAEATLFHKYLYDLAYFSEYLVLEEDGAIGPERFWSTGKAHIGGVEVLLRKDLTRNFFGWVSYTFSRAFYKYTDELDYVPFDFDQPHILTVLGVYKLPRNWQIGARFRLVSGNPTDPLQNGILDAAAGSHIPLVGEDNSDRAPAFQPARHPRRQEVGVAQGQLQRLPRHPKHLQPPQLRGLELLLQFPGAGRPRRAADHPLDRAQGGVLAIVVAGRLEPRPGLAMETTPVEPTNVLSPMPTSDLCSPLFLQKQPLLVARRLLVRAGISSSRGFVGWICRRNVLVGHRFPWSVVFGRVRSLGRPRRHAPLVAHI